MTLHLSEEPRLKAPLLQEYEGDAADPAAVAPVPETGARAVQLATRLAPKPRSGFARFALWVFSSLFALVLSGISSKTAIVASFNFIGEGVTNWGSLMAAATVIALLFGLTTLVSESKTARTIIMFPILIATSKKFGWDIVGFCLPMAFLIWA